MWPDIPYTPWRETCRALHLYSQVIGKYRLARTPWLNHSWHATFYVRPHGLTTGLVPDRTGGIEIMMDLANHRIHGTSADGRTAGFALEPMTVAEFHRRFLTLIGFLGGTGEFDDTPNEIVDPVPFRADDTPRPWDASAAERFQRALVTMHEVFSLFRTGFIGKASPVHLFWGAFDLAVTRFSGRKAPPHPGGIPALPDEVTREAYSHEVSSAGFWPGGTGDVDYPAFYSYAYPEPPGFAGADVEPRDAFYHEGLGEFILPYDVVRATADPRSTLLRFLQTTYEAAANPGKWDRGALERPQGEPGHPRAA